MVMIGRRRHAKKQEIIQDQVQLTWLDSEHRGKESSEKKGKMGIANQYYRVPETGHHSKHRSAPGSCFSFNNKFNIDF